MHDKMAKGRQLKGEKHPMAKLLPFQVREIRRQREDGETLMSIAERFGIHHSQVSHIVSRKHWKEVA